MHWAGYGRRYRHLAYLKYGIRRRFFLEEQQFEGEACHEANGDVVLTLG